jgi:fluoroacetyl-CoA thioesterase
VFEQIVPGLVGQSQVQVSPQNTAQHLGSGNVKVFATPEMVLLIEMAGVAAVDHLLPAGYRTVGVGIQVSHTAATPLGMTVRAKVELLRVEGRKLVFRVEAADDVEKIGEGVHERMIVSLAKFNERVQAKKARV